MDNNVNNHCSIRVQKFVLYMFGLYMFNSVYIFAENTVKLRVLKKYTSRQLVKL